MLFGLIISRRKEIEKEEEMFMFVIVHTCIFKGGKRVRKREVGEGNIESITNAYRLYNHTELWKLIANTNYHRILTRRKQKEKQGELLKSLSIKYQNINWVGKRKKSMGRKNKKLIKITCLFKGNIDKTECYSCKHDPQNDYWKSILFMKLFMELFKYWIDDSMKRCFI